MHTRSTIASACALGLTTVGLAIAPTAIAQTHGCGYAAGYIVRANSFTSCPFARNVARAYAGGDRSPRVFSPTTGRSYRLLCRGGINSAYCTGANHAYVSLNR